MGQKMLVDLVRVAYSFVANTTLSEVKMEQLEPLSIKHDDSKIYLDFGTQHFPIKLPKNLNQPKVRR